MDRLSWIFTCPGALILYVPANAKVAPAFAIKYNFNISLSPPVSQVVIIELVLIFDNNCFLLL